MKNIFNPTEQEEIRKRLEKITPESKSAWGEMNVAQMLTHCSKSMQMPTGELMPTLSPMRFIGQFFKKKVLGEGSLGRNSPTAKEMKVVDVREFNSAKQEFLESYTKLIQGGESGAIAKNHPFFGKMTAKEWGRINYKHLDHHFSQFGA